MNLKLHEIDISDAEEMKRWDAFIDNADGGTVFHKSFWLLAHEDVKLFWANRMRLYAVIDGNGQWMAAFPIPYRRFLNKNLIIMPYFTPYLGPAFRRDDSAKKYKTISMRKDINALIATEMKAFGMMLLYGFDPGMVDIQPYIWEGFMINVHYTYILKLDDMDEVWKGLEQKRRNDINKGAKSGFKVVWGFEQNISRFIELNTATFKRQKVERYDHALMTKLFVAAHENKACDVGVVFSSDGEPLAANAIVWDKKRAYYIGGGISGKDHSAMSYLMWDTIRYAKERLGLNEFDFEGSMVPGIENYFRKFGGDIVPYYNLMGRLATIAKWIKG